MLCQLLAKVLLEDAEGFLAQICIQYTLGGVILWRLQPFFGRRWLSMGHHEPFQYGISSILTCYLGNFPEITYSQDYFAASILNCDVLKIEITKKWKCNFGDIYSHLKFFKSQFWLCSECCTYGIGIRWLSALGTIKWNFREFKDRVT